MNKRGVQNFVQNPIRVPSAAVEVPVFGAGIPALGASAPSASGKKLDPAAPARKRRTPSEKLPQKRFAAISSEDLGTSNHQAELFYLQKQIQLQTQMIFILEDGTRVQGVIEWYDRNSIKVRGKLRMLIYKTAIKYLYKAGEIGTAPEV